MPRVSGQIDVAKNEAIIDAALGGLAERGVLASVEEIARRAGVSKQTIYNHYGSKAELVRAIVARRVSELTAPLAAPDAAGHAEVVLARLAKSLLGGFLTPRGVALMRLAVLSVSDSPEISEAYYESGPQASRQRLAAFFAAEAAAGRLDAPDPGQAADLFIGMASGWRQLVVLLGHDARPADDELTAFAEEIAARFMRAYGPVPAAG